LIDIPEFKTAIISTLIVRLNQNRLNCEAITTLFYNPAPADEGHQHIM
jgi:hypothetical protein